MAFQLAAAIPGIIGWLGSLFGKKQPKETQYTAMQNPQQAQLMQKLLSMIGGRMGQPSAGMQPTNDAMNMLYSRFFGRPYQPQQQQPPSYGPAMPNTTGQPRTF